MRLVRVRRIVSSRRLESALRTWTPSTVLVVAYVGWFSWESLRMYSTYSYPPFDLAVFDQGLWLLSHFHDPFVTVMGRNLFGDHSCFILLALVPIYRLLPEPQGILVVQAVVLGVTALPIFAIARRWTRSVGIATAMGATYLLSPALQQGNLEQFHPECLQVLVFTLAIYAAIESRGWLLAVMVVLTLLTKEDASILVVPLGIWVAVRRNRRWGAAIIISAAAYAIVVNEFVIPALLGGPSLYTGRIPFGGVSGFVATVLRRPAQVWSYVHSQGRLFYLWQMGLSAGWVFLLAPEFALISLLAVLENILSADPYMHQILYHYSLRVVPVLVIATTWALARERRRWWRRLLTLTTVLCALWSCVLWGLAPFSSQPEPINDAAGAATAATMNYLLQDLPANASVSALYPYVSHIDHRVHVYVWPAPFTPSNWGLLNDPAATLPAPSSVTYLILPTPLSPADDSPVFNGVKSSYHVLAQRAGLVLYQRN